MPRTVSCKSKLPVLDWTAAEAANLLLNCFDHIRLFRNMGIEAEFGVPRKPGFVAENMKIERAVKPALAG